MLVRLATFRPDRTSPLRPSCRAGGGALREPVGLHDLRHALAAGVVDAGASLAEPPVLARHPNAKVTGVIYVGVSENTKAQNANKLVDAGFGA